MPQDNESPDDAAHQRDGARDSLFLLAELRSPALVAPTTIRVRNLSPGGLMADYVGPLERGDPVAIDLRGIGTVNARIAWNIEMRIGVAFDVQVDPRLARIPIGKGRTTSGFLPPVSPVRRQPF